ncbi:hypothetical protein [Parasediminibacterium sp. JCM 36343]|uniref:hypothetical protein n=1 Tax=Parasediminibacterium sp. JCM 36343 TaxID=3374279 RepID=UPI00397C6ABA
MGLLLLGAFFLSNTNSCEKSNNQRQNEAKGTRHRRRTSNTMFGVDERGGHSSNTMFGVD